MLSAHILENPPEDLKPSQHKKYSNIELGEVIDTIGVANFHHELHRVVKPKKGPNSFSSRNVKKWFAKFYRDDRFKAVDEVLAQEFLRLLMPWHPKTR